MAAEAIPGYYRLRRCANRMDSHEGRNGEISGAKSSSPAGVKAFGGWKMEEGN